MPGARSTRSLVYESKKAHERNHYRFAEQSDIPCTMGRRLMIALSPVSGLVSHRRRRIDPPT
jgi:hypothetical protein